MKAIFVTIGTLAVIWVLICVHFGSHITPDPESCHIWPEHTFVLSLARRRDKRDHMTKMLEKLDIPFEFIDGVDTQEFNVESACPSSAQPIGKIGCALAHVKAFEHIASQPGSDDTWFLFFQDDVAPTVPDVKERMAIALDKATSVGSEVVYFGFCLDVIDFMQCVPIGVHQWQGGVACPHAIALTKRAAAAFATSLRPCTKNADISMKTVMRQLNGTFVAKSPYSYWNPGGQFMFQKTITSAGLFEQARSHLNSDIRHATSSA